MMPRILCATLGFLAGMVVASLIAIGVINQARTQAEAQITTAPDLGQGWTQVTCMPQPSLPGVQNSAIDFGDIVTASVTIGPKFCYQHLMTDPTPRAAK